ncbi:MerR family transcriptional regulator [Paenibacillus cisolokensis]|jgi:DNA-binding transcriptional MerR regulator|uniref:HTH-type transcriptional regulator CueR n=1 Tax=Paenibacillus cisolokensis TaxID=1658519 RepID=A0ABQ4N4F6_9BACL|nr:MULTISPECIES: MerR family transcriptional regulator [Paenibacillus]ALS28964.1 transcriptional regulator [Paenibacillus sp. 32O-W]GIQ63075.1 HTH-type transcriptional regulator CueR [Paenibacillus cisolokensis]
MTAVPEKVVNEDGDKQRLYRIGELSKLAGVSPRTIDYYTSIGLIEPASRSAKNYRLYGDETLLRLERIEQLKRQKYSLEEIKHLLDSWSAVTPEEQVSKKLTDLQLHLEQLEREVKELEPVIRKMKPRQVNRLLTRLMPQTAACIEALMFLSNKGPFM